MISDAKTREELNTDEPVNKTTEFLKAFYDGLEEGYIQLCAIVPDGKVTATSIPLDDLDCATKFIDQWIDHVNLYWGPNPVKPKNEWSGHGRPTKDDVTCIYAYYVDQDADAGTNGKPSNVTAVVDCSWQVMSGHGYQSFFIKPQPTWLELEDDRETAVKQAEGVNRAIAHKCHGDTTHNIDRLMRLPYTKNFPTATKRKKYGNADVLPTLLTINVGGVFEGALPQPIQDTSPAVNCAPAVDLYTIPGLNETWRTFIQTGEHVKNTFPSRSERDWAVLMKLVALTLNNAAIEQILTDPANGISDRFIEKGNALAEIKRARSAIEPTWYSKMNERYFVVKMGGKVRVFEDNKYETSMSFLEFRKLFHNQRVESPWVHRLQNPINAGEGFLTAIPRPTFQELVLDVKKPPGPDGERYNIYEGFAFEPEANPDKTSRFWEHILKVNCAGNKENYKYLRRWMAFKVQNPDRRNEVALVQRGPKGVGKTMLSEAFSKLFGNHAGVTANVDDITKFAGWTINQLVLVLEEGFFAGSFSVDSLLKQIITDARRRVEWKHVNSIQITNCISLIINSNEDRVIRATIDERRYFVLNCDSTPLENFNADESDDYFNAIHKDLEEGGYDALLYELLTLDLSGFRHRRPPQTVGLIQQKEENLEDVDRVVRQMLEGGLGTKEPFDTWPSGHPFVFPRKVFENEYRTVAGNYHQSQQYVSSKLWKIFGDEFEKDPLPRTMKFNIRKDSRGRIIEQESSRTWQLPPLKRARELWDKYRGYKTTWPDIIVAHKGEDDLPF